jgi:predicted dehydrogenase
MPHPHLSRRRFLQTLGVAAVAGPWAGRLRASQRVLRHASIGAAGQALSDVNAFARHPAFQLVAVADVDLARIVPLQAKFPKVRVYQDWRELLEREAKHIDSVSVAIPDHMHALVATRALEKGKAVYVEKPMCNTLRETRQLTELARRRRLPTQMGIQISSTRDQLYGEALVRSGIVGKIREVHTFSNKSWGDDGKLVVAEDPVPAPFDWDGWLGVSETRPFIAGAYHPGQWRRRIGFGTGTLGDMGCHIYSPPYRALNLTSPVSVTSHGPAPTDANWAVRARVMLTYPGTEFTAGATVNVWWYDGGELPPAEIVETLGSRLPEQGSVLVGTNGLLVLPHMRPAPFAIVDGRDAVLPEIAVPDRDHYAEFIDVVLDSGRGGRTRCSTNFDYSGPLTESVIIGNAAARFPGETLAFDAKALAFPHRRDANEFLTRSYRRGMGI